MAKKNGHHHALKLDKVIEGKIAAKLSTAGINRVGQVRKMTDAELRALPGIGAKAVEVTSGLKFLRLIDIPTR